MPKSITRIEPVGKESRATKLLRVAAYVRTSTDNQTDSLKAQRSHYEQVIKARSDWFFVDIYSDESSGTRKDNRPGLMRLIKDCENHMIDLILVKSVSRWARCTADSIELIRRMKQLGVGIIFESENICYSSRSVLPKPSFYVRKNRPNFVAV